MDTCSPTQFPSQNLTSSELQSQNQTNDLQTIQERVRAIQSAVFNNLRPVDLKYVEMTSELLAKRDSNPSVCAGQALVLINDPEAPRPWKIRARIYRAECFMLLGFKQEAKSELIKAQRLLVNPNQNSHHIQVNDDDKNRYQPLEALLAWTIALGKINWGITKSNCHRTVKPHQLDSFNNKTKSIRTNNIRGSRASFSRRSCQSSALLNAGWPLSRSLSALDLQSP